MQGPRNEGPGMYELAIWIDDLIKLYPSKGSQEANTTLIQCVDLESYCNCHIIQDSPVFGIVTSRDELTDRLCKTQTPMDFFSVYALSHKHPPVIAPSLWEIPKHESNTDTWMDHWTGMGQGGCSFKYWTVLLWSHLVKVCIEIFPVGKNWQWVKLSRQNPVSNSPNWKPLEEFWEVCMVGK